MAFSKTRFGDYHNILEQKTVFYLLEDMKTIELNKDYNNIWI